MLSAFRSSEVGLGHSAAPRHGSSRAQSSMESQHMVMVQPESLERPVKVRAAGVSLVASCCPRSEVAATSRTATEETAHLVETS